ncbi:hypothetical protein C8R45DRAFT_1104804 [Mycena sanguinolenta]|nr:hypothetical protein C8R45DRAFT_1104804 [Mycena sanguinolenta]
MSRSPEPQEFVDGMLSSSDIAHTEADALGLGPGKFGRSTARELAGHLHRKPNLVGMLLLLILIGLRPVRLSDQLCASDQAAWLNFRNNLIQRWQTVMITTGLVMRPPCSAIKWAAEAT